MFILEGLSEFTAPVQRRFKRFSVTRVLLSICIFLSILALFLAFLLVDLTDRPIKVSTERFSLSEYQTKRRNQFDHFEGTYTCDCTNSNLAWKDVSLAQRGSNKRVSWTTIHDYIKRAVVANQWCALQDTPYPWSDALSETKRFFRHWENECQYGLGRSMASGFNQTLFGAYSDYLCYFDKFINRTTSAFDPNTENGDYFGGHPAGCSENFLGA